MQALQPGLVPRRPYGPRRRTTGLEAVMYSRWEPILAAHSSLSPDLGIGSVMAARELPDLHSQNKCPYRGIILFVRHSLYIRISVSPYKLSLQAVIFVLPCCSSSHVPEVVECEQSGLPWSDRELCFCAFLTMSGNFVQVASTPDFHLSHFLHFLILAVRQLTELHPD